MKSEIELLNFREAAALLGVSVRSFHALRAESWFPPPLELGPRLLRWRRAELVQALAEKAPRQLFRAEPEQLASARGTTPCTPEPKELGPGSGRQRRERRPW